jgi:hypothetical protein
LLHGLRASRTARKLALEITAYGHLAGGLQAFRLVAHDFDAVYRPGSDPEGKDMVPLRRQGPGQVDELPGKVLVDKQVTPPPRPRWFGRPLAGIKESGNPGLHGVNGAERLSTGPAFDVADANVRRAARNQAISATQEATRKLSCRRQSLRDFCGRWIRGKLLTKPALSIDSCDAAKKKNTSAMTECRAKRC